MLFLLQLIPTTVHEVMFLSACPCIMHVAMHLYCMHVPLLVSPPCTDALACNTPLCIMAYMHVEESTDAACIFETEPAASSSSPPTLRHFRYQEHAAAYKKFHYTRCSLAYDWMPKSRMRVSCIRLVWTKSVCSQT
jgi:hypothetical protein